MPNELMKEKLWEIEQLQARISQLEETLDNCRYSDAHHRNKCKELQARIEELSKPILCAKCSDHIVAGEQGAICEVCASTQESAITGLQGDIEELEKAAIVWHKYPEEKPVNGRYYITYDWKNVEAHFWRGGAEYWADMASSEDDIIINEVHGITHWAYLPAPPEEGEC